MECFQLAKQHKLSHRTLRSVFGSTGKLWFRILIFIGYILHLIIFPGEEEEEIEKLYEKVPQLYGNFNIITKIGEGIV